MTLQLDDWQKEIVEHDGNVLLCTGRQVGKTTVFAIKAAEYMVNHPESKIIVVSLTEDQAQLIIVMTLDYLERNHKAQIGRGKYKPAKNWIYLKNKSHMIARPVGITGGSIRGFTGDVLIVDEASRMPEDVWTAAKPTLLTTGGKIWMCSTPHGRQGYFYECFVNKSGRFKVWQVNCEEVITNRPINDFWTEQKREAALAFLAQERKDMSAARYGQEYLGLFLDELRQVFSDDLIRKCMVLKRRRSIRPYRKYFLGVDIARMGDDESTFEIIDRTHDILEHVENQVTRKTLTTETTQRIISLDRTYQFKQIFVDDGGMGVGVFDQLLVEEQTRRKVIAINNTSRPLDREEKQKKKTMKEDIYNNMLMLMERGKLKLLDDPEIFQSLKSVQFEIDQRGKVRYFGNYTHIADGLVRACWCSTSKHFNTIMAWA